MCSLLSGKPTNGRLVKILGLIKDSFKKNQYISLAVKVVYGQYDGYGGGGVAGVTLLNCCVSSSVVDPGPVGSESFSSIRIRAAQDPKCI